MDPATVASIISIIVLLAVGALSVLMYKTYKLADGQLTVVKNQVEALQAQLEGFGGPKAPPKRDQASEH